ncbi:MAG: hypothetical protein M1835_003763, partial [Candelina submexicana]
DFLLAYPDLDRNIIQMVIEFDEEQAKKFGEDYDPREHLPDIFPGLEADSDTYSLKDGEGEDRPSGTGQQGEDAGQPPAVADSGSTAQTPTNYWDTVEVLLDFIPQQYSYDNISKTSTTHLAFMEKEFSQIQSKTFNGDFYANGDGQEQLQVWTFKQKPSRMVIRPEVLQNKLWNIRLKFLAQQEPGNLVNWYSLTGPNIIPGVTGTADGPVQEPIAAWDQMEERS